MLAVVAIRAQLVADGAVGIQFLAESQLYLVGLFPSADIEK